jgi:hypothetical protein
MKPGNTADVLESAEPYGVCIVGSGFVGTILADRLAEKVCEPWCSSLVAVC